MPNRSFSDIVGRIEALVPQLPRPVTIEHLRRAARKACEKTLAWRYVPTKTMLLPGVHIYTFDIPTNTEVEHIFGASMNGEPLDLINLDVAIARYPEWADLFSGEDASVVWSETPSSALGTMEYNESLFDEGSEFVLPDAIVADGGRPAAITMVSPQEYVILPLPDGEEDYELRLWVALKPGRSATEMDDKVFDELEDAFVYGALETILAMPMKAWTNPEFSVHYGQLFREEYLEKRRRANIGHVRGPMSARSVSWL